MREIPFARYIKPEKGREMITRTKISLILMLLISTLLAACGIAGGCADGCLSADDCSRNESTGNQCADGSRGYRASFTGDCDATAN